MTIERGFRFPVLDDGFIQVVDWMGDDHDICSAARVSFGKGTKSVSDDRQLIRYLMRNFHTSPFEQVELKLHVRMPMDVMRQWVRHRTMSMNEYSTRYSEAIDARQTTKPDEWRLQSTANKQGSGGFVTEWPGNRDPYLDFSPGEYLSTMESAFHESAKEVYEERLKFGVAREQARKDLPLSTYTEAFIKFDLHNLLHFLRLRMDSHAQLEIRSYANIIGNEIVAKLWPITWEAFQDYRLQAMQLTRLDIEIIQAIMGDVCGGYGHYGHNKAVQLGWIKQDESDHGYSLVRSREREECEVKLTRLGIEVPWKHLGERAILKTQEQQIDDISAIFKMAVLSVRHVQFGNPASPTDPDPPDDEFEYKKAHDDDLEDDEYEGDYMNDDDDDMNDDDDSADSVD